MPIHDFLQLTLPAAYTTVVLDIVCDLVCKNLFVSYDTYAYQSHITCKLKEVCKVLKHCLDRMPFKSEKTKIRS